jgi:deazaflavin-dependent oxidoreductase (nitroreductase family)
MNGNDFIAWVLRSPLHGMLSNGMMLITITGRKTGKEYTTPVGFFREGDELWILTSLDRTWWRNLKDGADVDLLLQRKQVRGFAELVQNESTVQTRLCDYVRHIPQAVKPMSIHMENGEANAEDVARVVNDRLFVKINLL